MNSDCFGRGKCLLSRLGAGWTAAARSLEMGGGKSGHRRAGRQVTPGGREPTESATENIPPKPPFAAAGKGEMVR